MSIAPTVSQAVLRRALSTRPAMQLVRSFQTSSRRFAEGSPAPLPARRPVGAFRGGLFGFLLGTTLTSAAVYYYVLQDYRAGNDQLNEDIYALQKATQQLSHHIATLEDKLRVERKK